MHLSQALEQNELKGVEREAQQLPVLTAADDQKNSGDHAMVT